MIFFGLVLGTVVLAETKVEDLVDDKVSNSAVDTAGSHIDSQELIDVSILYTGNRFGGTRERYNFPSLQSFNQVIPSAAVEIHSAHHVMVQDDWLLFSEEQTVKSTLDFLGSQEIACQQEADIVGWKKEYELIFSGMDDNVKLKKILGEPQVYHAWHCENELEQKTKLVSQNDKNEMSWQWEDFEFRPSVHVLEEGTEKITIVGRSMQELSRTVTQIAKEQRWSPNTIYVDAGSFVGGSTSVKPNGLSLHRTLEYDVLEDLEPKALGIGENELILGMSNFQQEIKGLDLPYVATNLKQDQKSIFPTSIQVDVNVNEEQVSVAFLGILDPEWMEQVPILASEKVEIEDPVEAISREVALLMESENPPEVLIVLTTASSGVMEDIRIRASGIDLMFGDSTMATFRLQNRKLEFSNYERGKRGAPVTLPMDGLSSLQLVVDKSLRTVQHQTIFIREDFPITPEISTVITQNRMQYYPIQDKLLLAPTGTGWEQAISQSEWEDIACQLVLEETGTDTVLLRDLPQINRTAGLLTKKQIADSLTIMDVVEVHRISGSTYSKFLSQIHSNSFISCGAKPSSKTLKVRGRPIDDAQMYSLATTDQTRLSSELKMLIPAHQSLKVWDRSGAEIRRMANGEYLSLRELVISRLEAEDGLASAEKIKARMSNQVEQEVIFRLREASLLTEGLHSPEDERYDSVPESMLNNPSSSTIGWGGDVALEYYSPKIRSDLRYRASFSELSIGTESQEVNDDWILSSSHTLPGIKISTGLMTWSPYSELMFDSEFSPQELDDGTFQLKQSDLSLTAGISSLSWKIIQNIKLGVLANRDLAQLNEKPTEFGGKVEWTTKKAVASYLHWTMAGTMQVYANTPDDDASDLRARLGVNNKLTLPLSRYMGVSLYADLLGVQGRTDINNEAVFAWNLGVSMDVLGAFALIEE